MPELGIGLHAEALSDRRARRCSISLGEPVIRQARSTAALKGCGHDLRRTSSPTCSVAWRWAIYSRACAAAGKSGRAATTGDVARDRHGGTPPTPRRATACSARVMMPVHPPERLLGRYA